MSLSSGFPFTQGFGKRREDVSSWQTRKHVYEVCLVLVKEVCLILDISTASSQTGLLSKFRCQSLATKYNSCNYLPPSETHPNGLVKRTQAVGKKGVWTTDLNPASLVGPVLHLGYYWLRKCLEPTANTACFTDAGLRLQKDLENRVLLAFYDRISGIGIRHGLRICIGDVIVDKAVM